MRRIYLDKTSISDLVGLIKENTYNKGDAYGFSIDEVEPSLVSAYLLVTRPEVRQVYDDDSGSVVDEEIQTVETVPFRIDTRYNILEVLADKKRSSSVSSKLGQLSSWGISVETINMSPKKVLDAIQLDYRTEITSIKISNYEIADSISGDFQVNIDNQNVGEKLVSEYQGNISYIGVRIGKSSDNVTIGLYDSGSVLIYNDLGEYSSVMDVIKKTISGSEGMS